MFKVILIILLSQWIVACGDEAREFPKYDTVTVLGSCDDDNVGQTFIDKAGTKLFSCLDGNWVETDNK